jgi:hypothetical protein
MCAGGVDVQGGRGAVEPRELSMCVPPPQPPLVQGQGQRSGDQGGSAPVGAGGSSGPPLPTRVTGTTGAPALHATLKAPFLKPAMTMSLERVPSGKKSTLAPVCDGGGGLKGGMVG